MLDTSTFLLITGSIPSIAFKKTMDRYGLQVCGRIDKRCATAKNEDQLKIIVGICIFSIL